MVCVLDTFPVFSKVLQHVLTHSRCIFNHTYTLQLFLPTFKHFSPPFALTQFQWCLTISDHSYSLLAVSTCFQHSSFVLTIPNCLLTICTKPQPFWISVNVHLLPCSLISYHFKPSFLTIFCHLVIPLHALIHIIYIQWFPPSCLALQCLLMHLWPLSTTFKSYHVLWCVLNHCQTIPEPFHIV